MIISPSLHLSVLTVVSEELEAIALPEFDDPNIDKDAAIAGVLGESLLYFIHCLVLTHPQRTTHLTLRFVPPSPTQMTHPFLCLPSGHGQLVSFGPY